ncbi:MAG: cation:dicarboxylase symporter family transporter [Treponema sp.]|jgi:Na+/H+-dicarboxylate symporter|nr:cation:dicarboxylase symporter family transporter [Treponema sp.]
MLYIMKIWVKLLVGSVLGTILGFLLPYESESVSGILAWFEQFALHLGRYSVMPLLFFALIIAVYELRMDKEFWPLAGKSFLVMICGAIGIIFLGIVVTLLFLPARIPIQEEQVETITLELPETILQIFPDNMFNALFTDGTFIFPLCVLAFFIAMGLSSDRNYSRPVIGLADSLSRIVYHISVFFTEILALGIIALSAYWAVRFHAVLATNVFWDLILLLGIFSLVLSFGIFPLLLYLLKSKNPWAQLYGSLGPAIGGFFSGDVNFTLPLLIRHVKENLGVRRRANAVTISLFAVFGRAGSAMVAAASFIVIIKSYSILGISPVNALSIGVRAVLISFLLARHPGTGAYTALAVLGMSYDRGFEAGYLILKPLAFYLIAIGAFIDTMFCSFASYAVGKMSGFQEDKDIRHFI